MPRRKVSRSSHGFSMVELAVVVGIILIVLAAAIPQISKTMKEARVRAAYETVLTEMRRAHEIAIDRRRVVVLTFAPKGGSPASVTMTQEIFVPGVGGAPGTYTLAPVVNTPNPETLTLPPDMDLILPSSIPTTPPDSLGTTPSSATDFGYAPNASGAGQSTMYFQVDGTVVRDSPTGAVASGVIYVGRTNDLYASRAVSILGPTGRVKGWRMDPGGTKWIEY
jgi:prepilin-type N-terminal cleavage/methylation domain-containing protein